MGGYDDLGSNYLRGPELVDWLADTLGPAGMADLNRHGTSQRRIRSWRHGGAAALEAADRIVTRAGHHLAEVPPEVWVERRRDARRT